jgi:hypothetical protein
MLGKAPTFSSYSVDDLRNARQPAESERAGWIARRHHGTTSKAADRDPAEPLVVGQARFEVLGEEPPHDPPHRSRLSSRFDECRDSFQQQLDAFSALLWRVHLPAIHDDLDEPGLKAGATIDVNPGRRLGIPAVVRPPAGGLSESAMVNSGRLDGHGQYTIHLFRIADHPTAFGRGARVRQSLRRRRRQPRNGPLEHARTRGPNWSLGDGRDRARKGNGGRGVLVCHLATSGSSLITLPGFLDLRTDLSRCSCTRYSEA